MNFKKKLISAAAILGIFAAAVSQQGISKTEALNFRVDETDLTLSYKYYRFDAEGEKYLDEYTLFTRDDEGRLLTRTKYELYKGEFYESSKQVYTYNEAGLMTSKQRYSADDDGEPLELIEDGLFRYDSKGKLIDEVYYIPDTDPKEIDTEYKYVYPSDTTCKYDVYYGTELHETYEQTYNDKGLLIKETETYNGDTHPTRIQTYEYNEKGVLTKEKANYYDGKSGTQDCGSVIHTITFDDQGRELLNHYVTYLDEADTEILNASQREYSYDDNVITHTFSYYDWEISDFVVSYQYVATVTKDKVVNVYKTPNEEGDLVFEYAEGYEYTYDEDGNILTNLETVLDEDGKVESNYCFIECTYMKLTKAPTKDGDVTVDLNNLTSDVETKINTQGAAINEVKVDGTAIASSNYSLNPGNTVALKKDYVKTLAVGNHTVEVTTAGGSVSITLTIKNTAPTPTPEKKGCGSSIIAASAIVSLLAITGAALVLNKKKEK